MTLEREHGDLGGTAVSRDTLPPRSMAVQSGFMRRGVAPGLVHGSALPLAPELQPLPTGDVALTRSFHFFRQTDEARIGRR